MFAKILELKVELRLDVLVDRRGQADAAGIGQRFKAGGNIDAVAINVVTLDDHVAEVDADPKLDALGLWLRRAAHYHFPLNSRSAGYGVHDTIKFHQRSIAHQLDDAAAMLGDQRLQDRCTSSLDRGVRAGLVRLHQAAVADYIGG